MCSEGNMTNVNILGHKKSYIYVGILWFSDFSHHFLKKSYLTFQVVLLDKNESK